MTDRFVTVPDSLELPPAVKVPVARLVGPTGAAATPADLAAATAEQGEKADASDVAALTLMAPLALTVPAGFPAGQVYRVTLTQDGTGGHTVTYNDLPVTVDTTAGAVTTVELHPAGAGYVVRYPVADLDAQVSALAEDGGSALGASLSSTYATHEDAAHVRRAVLRTAGNAQSPRPLISIIDDDGNTDLLDVLAPIAQARNIPIGAALVGNSECVTDPVRRAQILDLQNNHGWEVLSHTMGHINIATTSAADYIADCEAYLAMADEYGFHVDSIVYPWGQEGANYPITPNYYFGGFSASDGINTQSTFDNYFIYRRGLGSSMPAGMSTLAEFQALIDSTITNNQWLVFMTHIGATDAAGVQLIEDVLDYAIAQGVEIVAPRDGLREFGALVQSGRRAKTAGTFYIRPNGVVSSSRYQLMEWDAGGKLETDSPGTLGSGRTVTYLIKAASPWSIGYGWVVERLESDGWQTQEFQTVWGKRYIRRWNGAAWSGWKEFLYGTALLTVTMPARTIAAHSTADKSHFSTLALAVDTWTARPTGSLEAGIIFNVWSHGNGAVNVRLANVTDAPIDVAERVWTLRAITT